MSTLSGIAAKGEKGKQKYVSLDINSKFLKNKGDSSDTNQLRKSNARQHGMQSLGKVPSARRPANLPSLKSEYSGNDPAVSLVPSGGTGWGSKPGETGPPVSPPPPTTTPPASAIVTVSTTTTPIATTVLTQDKSWSSITSSNLESSSVYFAHQSPYFQQEFPSLSGEANTSGLGPNKIDPAHLPGPSLRPQNEGTWIQGGGRGQGPMGAGVGSQQGIAPAPGPLNLPHPPQGLDVVGGRSSLAPSGVAVGPGGLIPQQIPPQHYRLMPPFMMRQNMAAGGFLPNYQGRPRFPDSRFIPPNRGPPVDQEEVTTRPIIKEEDLKVMDEIGRDTGWAAHDEIDYNQTLSFSDEEGAQDDDSKGKIGRQSTFNKDKNNVDHASLESNSSTKENEKLPQEMRETQPPWHQPNSIRQGEMRQSANFPPSQARVSTHQVRQTEDDEVVRERQRLKNEEIAQAAMKAKQRKDEEEQRYRDSQQAAKRMLDDILEGKIRSKSGFEKEERKDNSGSLPTSVPQGSTTLMPEWDKNRSTKNSEDKDDRSHKENVDNLKEAENKGVTRERETSGQHFFPRQFPPNALAPRLQKQQTENRPYNRQVSGGNDRWQGGQQPAHLGTTNAGKHSRSFRDNKSTSDYEKDDICREKDKSNYNAGPNFREKPRPETGSDLESFVKEKEIDKFYDDKERIDKPNEPIKFGNSFQNEASIERENYQDDKLENEIRDLPHRPDRPQRPDSRESRASRSSRDSFREDKLVEETNVDESVSTWSDSVEHFQNNKYAHREVSTVHPYHHQRHIPGPITQEKLAAADAGRGSNLVPLGWTDKKTDSNKTERKWNTEGHVNNQWETAGQSSSSPLPQVDSWAQLTGKTLASTNEGSELNVDHEESKRSTIKSETTIKVETGCSLRRGGGHRGMRNEPRGSKPSYRGGGMSSSWRGQLPRNRRPNTGRDWNGHDPESEASDDISASTESGKEDRHPDQDRRQFSRSPKRGLRKSDKDDRVRDSNNKKLEIDQPNYIGMENARFDKKPGYDNRGGWFEPSGVPSRRGRGSAFRSKGSSTSRGMVDGYGPPTTKKPFSDSMTTISNEDKNSDSAQKLSQHLENGFNEVNHDDKMKLNQQQLSTGITGNTSRGGFKSQSQGMPPRLQSKNSERRERKPKDNNGWKNRGVKNGSCSGEEDGENTSEHEFRVCVDYKINDSRRSYNQGMSTRGSNRRHSSNRNCGRDNRHNGSSYDKDHGSRRMVVNGSGRLQGGKDHADQPDKKQSRPDKRNTVDRIDLNYTAGVDDRPDSTEEDQNVFAGDFQEVRSKKNVKEGNRQQKEESQRGSKDRSKQKQVRSQSPGSGPPPVNKGSNDRARTNKLAPRFAKMKEMKKQTQDSCDTNPAKDLTSPAPPPPGSAWDKPITAALRTSTPPITVPVESSTTEVPDQLHSTASSQRSTPNDDKAVCKPPREPVENALLDGASLPVQTIIFENTNFKAVPVDNAIKPKYTTNIVPKDQRPDKPRDKKVDEDNSAVGFKSPGPEIQVQEIKADPLQMQISFSKNEDSSDMKLDFRFDSELAQLTEDKTSKTITSMQMVRSMPMTTQSSAEDLQFKLDAVKKVWENPSTVSGEDNTASSYTPTFGNSVDEPNSYGKPADPTVADGSNSPEVVYNSAQSLANNPNAFTASSVQNMIKQDPSSNVCKVKPQPQSAMHPHAGPLSPPAGPFSSPAQPSQHINYQATAQYGSISTIPSPPTVFTPTHEQQFYQTFQLSNQQVLNSQARSQFSQFPYISQGIGQTSGFSQQNMYLQTGPPPSAPPAPTHPDMFPPQLSQYRIQPPTFGANQQLSANPNTVLTVKPPPQPIGAIGSKAQSYQPPSQPSQLYIYGDPQLLNQNYLQSSQMVQRAANNVVPTIAPSTASFYSTSSGGNATGYFPTANSNMHHLQAYSTQTPAATGMGSFGSILPRLIQQHPVQTAGGNRVQPVVHRSNSPAPPRASTGSPCINKVSQRQPSS